MEDYSIFYITDHLLEQVETGGQLRSDDHPRSSHRPKNFQFGCFGKTRNLAFGMDQFPDSIRNEEANENVSLELQKDVFADWIYPVKHFGQQRSHEQWIQSGYFVAKLISSSLSNNRQLLKLLVSLL